MLLIHVGLEGMLHAEEAATRLRLSADAIGKRWQRLRERLPRWPCAARAAVSDARFGGPRVGRGEPADQARMVRFGERRRRHQERAQRAVLAAGGDQSPTGLNAAERNPSVRAVQFETPFPALRSPRTSESSREATSSWPSGAKCSDDTIAVGNPARPTSPGGVRIDERPVADAAGRGALGATPHAGEMQQACPFVRAATHVGCQPSMANTSSASRRLATSSLRAR